MCNPTHSLKSLSTANIQQLITQSQVFNKKNDTRRI